MFDQMYYTRVRTDFDWFSNNRMTMFDYMEQLERHTRGAELTHTQDGWFPEDYKAEYLEENQSIYLTAYREEKVINFSFEWRFPRENEGIEKILLKYEYDVESKQLTKNPITITSNLNDNGLERSQNEEDINDLLSRHGISREEIAELYDWFLYDKFLVDWYDANGIYSRGSLHNLGMYTLVDKTK